MSNLQEFTQDLKRLVNKHSLDARSNTSDFILAEMLTEQYEAYEKAVKKQRHTAPPTIVQPR